jgi:hypothetical protein
MNAESMALLASLVGNNADVVKMQVCLNNAVSAIRVYINKEVDVEDLYPYQVAQLAYFYYKAFDDSYLESKSQGDRSVTLAKEIPDYIKKMLPRYVKPF